MIQLIKRFLQRRRDAQIERLRRDLLLERAENARLKEGLAELRRLLEWA